MTSSNPKRSRPDTDSDSDTENWPRFLVITGDGLKNLHAIAIMKAIEGMAGKPKSIKRLRTGQLLVELDKKSHSDNLLKTSMLVNVPVQCSPHRTLNTCKGVVRSYESMTCTEDELLDWLKPQGVVAVKQVMSRRTSTPKPTPVLFLTFNKQTLPKAVSVGFEYCRVDPFIPNPLRCFKCQGFGHHSEACKKAAVCASCGSPDHTHTRDTPCQNQAACINCKGNHPAFSRECPVWQKEKEVQTVRTTKGLSYPEARRLVFLSPPTYASMVQTNLKKDMGTQTCCTWLSDEPKMIEQIHTEDTKPQQTKESQSLASQTDTTMETENRQKSKDKPKKESSKRSHSLVAGRGHTRSSDENFSSEEDMDTQVLQSSSKKFLNRSRFDPTRKKK